MKPQVKLFEQYYQSQLTTMEPNPQLQQDILHTLQAMPAQQKIKHRWVWLGTSATAVTALAGGVLAVLFYAQPQPVTAETLLRQALATPTLQPGQIYQATSTATSADGVVTYASTISDGIHLEKINYDAQHSITGAELNIPQGNDNKVYDVYVYGAAGQFQYADRKVDSNVIEHRLVYNDDLLTNVSSDDPSTYKNMPDGWTQSFGKKSVLEVVSGSSLWRPYVSGETKHVSFFAEPIIAETTLNGIPTYKLDEKQDNIGFEMIAWISKQDGRLIQEQDAFGTTIYDEPIITAGTMPTTVDEFITALGVTNATVQDFDESENPGDTIVLPDDRSLNCGGSNQDIQYEEPTIVDDGAVNCDPQQ